MADDGPSAEDLQRLQEQFAALPVDAVLAPLVSSELGGALRTALTDLQVAYASNASG